VLLSRAAYPVNIQSEDHGVSYLIDYGANRPGVDNSATEYVHLAANPHWGDIWIKNKRSKDCIGQMHRAMGQILSCRDHVSAATRDDIDEMWELYAAWSRQVEDDGWGIATYDQSLDIYTPLEDLARFVTIADAECAGVLALRVMGRGDAGTWACEDGIPWPEEVAFFNNDLMKSGNKQMLRAYHQAAISHLLHVGDSTAARALVEGLAERLDKNLDFIEAEGRLPDNLHARDLVTLILEAAAAGVPLTSREVRFVQQQFDLGRGEYLSAGFRPHFHVFDASTPDGDYLYEPYSEDLLLYDLALPLGSCTSRWRNPASRPVIDCARVRDR